MPEPSDFLTSPFVAVRGSQPESVFADGSLTLPSPDHSQAGPGSSSSTDFLSQSFTSLDPGSSATSQDSFTATTSQPVLSTSPSQSALQPLAPRWPLSATDSAYVSHPFSILP
jgi:hypothetical protein